MVTNIQSTASSKTEAAFSQLEQQQQFNSDQLVQISSCGPSAFAHPHASAEPLPNKHANSIRAVSAQSVTNGHNCCCVHTNSLPKADSDELKTAHRASNSSFVSLSDTQTVPSASAALLSGFECLAHFHNECAA